MTYSGYYIYYYAAVAALLLLLLLLLLLPYSIEVLISGALNSTNGLD